ncbi:MAG TPA: MFS transporter, partial [Polyangiales bacterium]|nr:MFS transporter [Polyangiales bacterium]
ALSAGVFVLPFVLFSALAGQLSDKYPKHSLLRVTKLLEIVAMLVGAAGLCSGSLLVSLLALFLMGTQAAAFGPLKYGALPELVGTDKLLSANARVESGTFLAILLGALAGSALGQHAAAWTAGVLVLVSVAGYFAALQVPRLPAAAPELRVEYGLVRPTWRLIQLVRCDRGSWLATLGISWFWLIGSAVLSTLPRLVSLTGVAPGSLLGALLVVFTLGIAAGSLLCERFSHGRLELGLVPLGALGVSLFLADAAFSCAQLSAQPDPALWSWLLSTQGLHLSLDLFLLALASSLFTVPLYTLLQLRTPEAARARAISANNVMNAAFMVLGSVVLMALFALGASVTQVFVYFALLNLCVAAFAYAAASSSCLRVLCWVLGHVGYRLR